MNISSDDVLRWYSPKFDPLDVDDYTRAHVFRLAESFNRLPPLKPEFSALLIGSWGRETPLLSHFGCSRVACVRAPEPGVPLIEELRFPMPSPAASVTCQAHAVNLETESLPNTLADFDLVLAWEVIEHMQSDPARAIGQGIKALKVGGVISITTPNAIWYQHTLNHLLGRNSVSLRIRTQYPFSTHWREYAPVELADLVTSMGCRVLHVGSFLESAGRSLKGRVVSRIFEFLRRKSGNGYPSTGRHTMVIAEKVRESDTRVRPEWLYPDGPI